MWCTELQALDCRVSLQVEGRALANRLRVLTATYGPPRQGARIRYQLQVKPWARLVRNGRVLCVVDDPADLPPIFEHDLYAQLLARRQGGCVLHAAAVSRGGQALLLPGASGAGKSTLALALLQRGASYLTDETAVVDQAGQVRGLTRPIGLSPDRGAGPPPEFVVAICRTRARDGGVASLSLVCPPAAQLCHDPQPLGGVLLLNRPPGQPARQRRLSAGEALCALWSCAVLPSASELSALTDIAARYPVYEATNATLEHACDLAEQLWRELASAK